MFATTHPEMSVSEPTLYVAFELGKKDWKLAMTSGFGVPAVLRTVASGDLGGLERALRQGRQRLGLPAPAPVVSCYEAGRDGFWIHRALTQLGIANRVVDSASIEISRRARRAKTDRLDALKLVQMLVRVCLGERDVWHEVRVPTVADEAARQVSRERTDLVQAQTRVINQMRGWLATWGASLPSRRRGDWWTTVRDWAGRHWREQSNAARSCRGPPGDDRGADWGTRRAASGHRHDRGAGECVAPVGAAEGRGPDERVRVASRRAGVAGVPESAADRRTPGLGPHALRQR